MPDANQDVRVDRCLQLRPTERRLGQVISKLRPKLNYSNVIATVALFIALGGAAIAAGLPRNSVGAHQLKRGAVTARALRQDAVTAAKLAPRSVTAASSGPNAVGSGNLANGAVTSTKLAANSVTSAAIANGVITNTKLANELITTTKLANGAVTLAKLGEEVSPLLGTLRTGQTLRGAFDLGASRERIDLRALGIQLSVSPQQQPRRA